MALISRSPAGQLESKPISTRLGRDSARAGYWMFPTRTGASRQWLESPLWDSLWMLSGIWLLLIVVCAQSAGYVPLVPHLLTVGAVAFLWGGHILSPVVVGWANRGLRAHMLLNWPHFVVVPLGVMVMSATLGILGDLSQWPEIPSELTVHMNPRLVLFYAFLVWNTWHFASQHFGVLSIYRRTAGQLSTQDRSLDRAFCVAMTCVLTPLAWYAQDRRDLFGQLFAYLPSPSAMSVLGPVVIAAAVTLTISYLVVEIRKTKSSLPRGLYILSIGIQPVFGTISYPTYHFAVFSICHWLIALALASRVLSSEIFPERRPAAWQGGLGVGFCMGIVGFVLLSVAMFAIFHSRTFHQVIGIVPPVAHNDDSLFSYKTGTFQPAFGALSGAYFGFSFVHFLYDRYVYAFRRPEIREWIAPHLFSSTSR